MSGKGSIGGGIGDGDSCNWMKMKFLVNLSGGCFFTGPTLKVLNMELVPPKKRI